VNLEAVSRVRRGKGIDPKGGETSGLEALPSNRAALKRRMGTKKQKKKKDGEGDRGTTIGGLPLGKGDSGDTESWPMSV